MIFPKEVTKVSEWIALGKVGTIKHVISWVNPQGCQLDQVRQ
jgi:polyphosphate kinase 2 (PPK2 family)